LERRNGSALAWTGKKEYLKWIRIDFFKEPYMRCNFKKVQWKNSLISISILLIGGLGFCKQTVNIYLFPGQGSDKRIFDSISFDPKFLVKYIEYEIPDKGTSLKQYAVKIACQVDITQKFILIGVSLEGMICSELSEVLKTEKTIIISSAKNRGELPSRYKFQKIIPLYKIFPSPFLLAGAKILQPIVEPDRKLYKATFKSMLSAKNPKYIKRTIGMIIRWDRNSNSKKIIHIHGSNDHTLPLKNVKPDYIINSGSHMMTLTRYRDVNKILNLELLNIE
jgi:hypothetical protein